MTHKPMTPREDVEAITVALEVCAGLNKEACRISNNTIERTVTMLRALLAERDAAYRRGQEEMRREAHKLCVEISTRYQKEWRAGLKGNSHMEGQMDGSDECAEAILILQIKDAPTPTTPKET